MYQSLNKMYQYTFSFKTRNITSKWRGKWGKMRQKNNIVSTYTEVAPNYFFSVTYISRTKNPINTRKEWGMDISKPAQLTCNTHIHTASSLCSFASSKQVPIRPMIDRTRGGGCGRRKVIQQGRWSRIERLPLRGYHHWSWGRAPRWLLLLWSFSRWICKWMPCLLLFVEHWQWN